MTDNWKPHCNLAAIQARAEMLKDIRAFFARLGVLEVETPLLGHAIGTDPQLSFFSCEATDIKDKLYLQTSPEFCMKRLLAAGSGSIFQICKAFRQSEQGRFHNPEFSILEWYRIEFKLSQLMQETLNLLQYIMPGFNNIEAKKFSYCELFQQLIGLDPLNFDKHSYSKKAQLFALTDAESICQNQHDIWLDFFFTHIIQPELKKLPICLVYEYPSIQSSLAKLCDKEPRLCERFEVFLEGIEIGNGYYELTNANEQAQRFERELEIRQNRQLASVSKDERLIQALKSGLPECSGIAIGLDRLLMIKTGAEKLEDVITFAFDRA